MAPAAAVVPVVQPLGINLVSVMVVEQVHAPLASRLKEINSPAIAGLPFNVQLIALVTAPLLAVKLAAVNVHTDD